MGAKRMSTGEGRVPRAVSTITPLRISFAGGGTDLPAYYENHEGAVISAAIDKYIYVTVKRHSPLFQEAYRLSYSKTENVESLEDIENDIARECLRLIPVEPPLYIATAADLPASSGLGSSSSFAVGLLHALHLLRGERVSSAQLAEEACQVEIQILGNPIGKQDQYAAAFGGLNHFCFKKHGRVEIDHLVLSDNLINRVFSNSLLIWTGVQRSASNILQKQNKQLEKNLIQYGHLSSATNGLKNLILSPPDDFLEQFGALLENTWDIKKKLEGSISSSEIDATHQQLKALGSYGGKLSGAGGGGFLYEILSESAQRKVLDLFGNSRVIKIAYEPVGSRILSELY
jgi:D-glycero-alpha-D-manno-heptose-7-phosphate kinase